MENQNLPFPSQSILEQFEKEYQLNQQQPSDGHSFFGGPGMMYAD